MYYLHPPTYFVDLIVNFKSPKLDVSQFMMTFEGGASVQQSPLDFDDNSLDLFISIAFNQYWLYWDKGQES